MKTIRCIVVEDEPFARDILMNYIREVKGLVLLGVFENAGDALQFLQNNKVQLMFLDVHLPDLSGVSLLRSLVDPPKVIFATAHHEFAVEGFELNAVDYLLKPYAFQRFLKAVNKAFNQIYKTDKSIEGTKVNLKSGKTFYSLEKDKILFVEGCGDYVNVITDDNHVMVHTTLKEIDTVLSVYGCMRVHRSFIVNLNRLDSVTGRTITLGEKTIPIGKNYMDKLNKRLKLNRDESD